MSLDYLYSGSLSFNDVTKLEADFVTRLAELIDKQVPFGQIIKIMGHSDHTITKYARINGLKFHAKHKPKIIPPSKEQLEKLLTEDKSSYEIAATLSVSQPTVLRWLSMYGLKLKKRSGPKRTLPILYCLACGNQLKRSRMKYCNHYCQKEGSYRKYIEQWLKGEVDGRRGKYSISQKIRRYLFEINKNRCQKCGWGELNPKTLKIPLTINHIDGNWRNNRPENLELLCPNCHSLTPNYGSLNLGNGRTGRHDGEK